MNFRLAIFLILAYSSPLTAQDTPVFQFAAVPTTKPEFPLSRPMADVYDGKHSGEACVGNEQFTNFK